MGWDTLAVVGVCPIWFHGQPPSRLACAVAGQAFQSRARLQRSEAPATSAGNRAASALILPAIHVLLSNNTPSSLDLIPTWSLATLIYSVAAADLLCILHACMYRQVFAPFPLHQCMPCSLPLRELNTAARLVL